MHLKKTKIFSEKIHKTKKVLRENGVYTVCESARCPNIGECFEKPTATFMILGDICTRNCTFCSVTKGVPKALDNEEPYRIAKTAMELGLKHIVITSVTRDDLVYGGASHFAKTIRAIREIIPNCSIEVLTPDFNGSEEGVEKILDENVNVFNHNIETVPRLYPQIKPKSNYRLSLQLFDYINKYNINIIKKSGLIIGLGERFEEVINVMSDLKEHGCDILTIGQYLKPTLRNADVNKYVEPEIFKKLEWIGEEMGFLGIYSGPYVRSSYNAEKILEMESLNLTPTK